MAAFEAEEPFPQVLSRALTDCYTAAGWDLVTGEPLVTWNADTGQPVDIGGARSLPRLPGLVDLQRTAQEVVEQIGYDREITQRVRGFVDVRIGSLRLGTTGRFFEGGHPLDFRSLLRRNVVFELESVTTDQDKAFVMGAMLIRLYEQLLLEERERFSQEGTSPPLRHVTVIEEAHRLLRNVDSDSPFAHSLELFASLLAEVRAYGEGIVIAEQIPSKLIPDAVKNTAFKVVHRLPAADDRFAVGATMNLTDDQSEYVVSLVPGIAAIFMDGMDRPVLAAIRGAEHRESAASAVREPPLAKNARRSCGCGPTCRGQPCTLLQLRQAQLLLDRHPVLSLWTEVAVAAHIVDRSTPGFADSGALTELRGEDRRLTECAIAHAVEEALARRRRALQAYYDPDALGRHVAAAARYALGLEAENPCARDRGEWQAGLRRFEDVARALERLSANGGGGETVRAGAAERGVELRGATVVDQLAHLRSLPWARVSDEEQFLLVAGLVTMQEHSRVQKLVLDLVGARRGGDQQDLAAHAFDVLSWDNADDPAALVRMLVPAPAPVSDANRGQHGS